MKEGVIKTFQRPRCDNDDDILLSDLGFSDNPGFAARRVVVRGSQWLIKLLPVSPSAPVTIIKSALQETMVSVLSRPPPRLFDLSSLWPPHRSHRSQLWPIYPPCPGAPCRYIYRQWALLWSGPAIASYACDQNVPGGWRDTMSPAQICPFT